MGDIPDKFITKYDMTFWMHFTRELVITIGLGFINPLFAVGVALGVNITWEWKDGIHNDGFNFIDLLAGFCATVAGYLIHMRII